MIDGAYVDALLGELGNGLGVAGLSLDERGACALAIDDGPLRLDLQFQPRLGAIDLTVWLDGLALTEAGVQALLAANFCWQGAEGATFALEPLSGVPVLQRRCFENELANGGLSAAIERLVRHARTWPAHLASSDNKAAGAHRDPPGPSGGLRA